VSILPESGTSLPAHIEEDDLSHSCRRNHRVYEYDTQKKLRFDPNAVKPGPGELGSTQRIARTFDGAIATMRLWRAALEHETA
jgi:hypothetical protein